MPICEGSCRLTFLERQEVWNDCRSCKVRVGSNGNLLWEASVLYDEKKGCVMDTLKFTAMPFGLTNAPAVFMELMSRSGRKRRCRESFNKRGSGAKRKLSRCGRNQMGNESILALPEGAGDFVVYYDARSKDLEACLEKRRRLWVVEGLTLERCSTFGKKDKLEPSYVGPFEILGWIGPIVRLKIYVLWAEYRKLDWEFLFDELRVKVRWDSKRGPELTWERKDQMRSRELKRNGNVMVIVREVFVKILLESFGKLSIRTLCDCIWLVVA
ncbi:hypothetical protein Tco_0626421 [Tanacetum coccineum]|uniref:Uncharacterized protein n=1 Tax=Tanacetum coccineum TaxID=301880 RepID=A0ABQ4WJJ9_9ASTR